MPELPDVEYFKKYLKRKGLNKKIKNISFDSRVSKVLENSKSYFKKFLKNKKFLKVERHGKHLFINISEKDKLIEMHFGMTGFLKFFNSKKEKPEHPRVIFKFSNEDYLAYDCQRLLGEIKIIKSKEKYLKEHNIGKDALEFKEKEFIELMKNKKGYIKSALMSQKDIAGIGNIYSDELLFQSKIHPKKQISKLKEKDFKELYKNMIKVLKEAIKKEAEIEKLPKNWIIPKRHIKNSKCPNKNCTKKIKSIKINSRTSFYCPKCQK